MVFADDLASVVGLYNRPVTVIPSEGPGRTMYTVAPAADGGRPS